MFEEYSAQFTQWKKNLIGFKFTEYGQNIVTKLNVSIQSSGVDHALI